MAGLPADAPKTDRELLLQIYYDVSKMKNDMIAKCDMINDHEDRIGKLEMHDYAEMAVATLTILVIGWLVAAGLIRL